MFTHVDPHRPGARIAYDAARRNAKDEGVVIVQTPDMIHGYHMSWTRFLNRYLPKE
jgi:hypothetical protein